MIRPVARKSKWLVSLVLVTVAALLISGGCPLNELPVISSLGLLTQSEINPGMTAQLKCDATDPDDNELSYTWSADGGTISGSGSRVSWTAPDVPGTYTISIEVSDGDNIVTDQFSITVLAPNNPPAIESLTTDCPRVRQTHTATITCVATDPDGDELNYEWSVERGTISGEGDTVTWTAPGEYGTFVITVITSDGRGGEVTEEISIIVCSCGSAC